LPLLEKVFRANAFAGLRLLERAAGGDYEPAKNELTVRSLLPVKLAAGVLTSAA